MDRISEKLRVIDEQQAGWGLLKEKILRNPILPLVVSFGCGIIISNMFELSLLLWLGLGVIAVSLCVVLYKLSQLENYRFYIFILILLVMFFVLGGVRHKVYKTFGGNHINSIVGDERMLATVRGVVISKPRSSNYDNWELGRFKYDDPGTSFYLKLAEIETKAGFKKVAGKIRVSISEPVLDVEVGDLIQGYCWLDRIRAASNPGQFDFKRYAGNRNIEVSAYIRSRGAIEKLEKRTNVFLVFKNKLSGLANSLLVSDHDFEEENSALLEALIIGKRDKIDHDITKAFWLTGMLHFISLSGLHLGVLVTFVWIVLVPTGVSKKMQAGICIVVTILFLMVVPPRAPTIRAGIIAIFLCMANIFSRSPSSLNALSVCGLAMLLVRPTEIFLPGFQLSFGCVAGILFFTQHIINFVMVRIPFLSNGNVRGKFLQKLLYWIISLTATGLGAWLGGAGILLYHFYTINPLTVLWTVVVFPFVAVILIMGFMKLVIALVFPTVAMLMSFVIEYFIVGLIFVVKFISDVCPGQILIGAVPIFIIVVYYFVVVVGSNHWMVRPRVRKVLMTVGCLSVILSIGFIKYQRVYPKDMEMAVLNVGAGQATVVRSAGGNFVFDAGSSSMNDVGNRIINPYLRYAGTSEIDTIFVSHRHFDHYNGVCEIIKDNAVDNVVTNEGFVFEVGDSGVGRYFLKWLGKNDKKLEICKMGVIRESPKITMLWPSEDIAVDKSVDLNDKSQVNLIEFTGRKILLCGDIEKESQEKLLKLYPKLKADVVILPHHGIRKSLSDEFIKRLSPEIVVSSCSRQQYERGVKEISEDIKVFSTAKDGCIIIKIRNSKIEIY